MEMYSVGGCVRDEILGIPSKDVDFTVVLPKVQGDPFLAMSNRLKMMGFKVFLESPEFLTIRAQFPKGDVSALPAGLVGFSLINLTADFVLARKESDYTDGRRPDVVKPGTLEMDLARRDFTMNAIAKDAQGNFIDPHNGREDIEKRLIRAVGDPMERLREDALRAIRAIRFSITKDFTIEADLLMALHNAEIADLVSKVSAERVMDELNKMFRHDSLRTIIRLHEFPALMEAMFSGKVNLEATMKQKGFK